MVGELNGDIGDIPAAQLKLLGQQFLSIEFERHFRNQCVLNDYIGGDFADRAIGE